ncbi:T9SS type A sorting domain-containing protein [Kaistella flava (ex Peng et al. 2021)]|uniref:T9SS type A sorting domain-containing protein n=1 Tax=Kaistella flava (ex Peng et al. 2021) TaxID=2038776 RepID=A0A7M2YCF2_9FLAO|nr:GEVED domain-containing protein [Kaistella flava (ex Peng et al. 2021)]QOW11786.1 T9SS type A sorting domain-containing protein [Kaistella flava (ex Peng et al. 2021)]
MKKLLLACFMALGIGASAQFNYTADPGTNAAAIPFAVVATPVTAACIGNGASQAASATNTQVGIGINLGMIGQTNNGQAATVSVSYKKAGTGTGTLILTLFDTEPGGTTWNITELASVAIPAATITTCQTLTATIPSGVLKTDGSRDYAYGYFFARTAGNSTLTTADYVILQDVVTTAPACTTITAPVNGSTIGSGALNIMWNAAPTATGYKLTVGTTAGGSDVFNGTITGGVTNQFVPVSKNATYYAKVVPTNANGNATGCTEITFNTDNTVSYCAVDVNTLNPSYERISNVKFANINNPSTAVVAYEDFTAIVANVVKTKTYQMIATISGFDNDKTSVWIDYNQDGDFTTDERVDLSAAAAATGNITIPTTALLGNTRMRIRTNFSVFPAPCGTTEYGQVEDYTVNIVDLALPSCVTVTATPLQAPTTTLTWAADTMATEYKVYVGTTSGGTDIANGTSVTTTSFAVNGLSKNTTYFAKVVSSNSLGDATGCTEISFTTPADWTYCAATHTTVGADRIAKVVMADIDNSSTVTTIPGGYEDFTAVVGSVEKDGTYPVAITVASGNVNDKVKVWIDYNQNGIFDDNEMTLLTYVSTTSTTGNITIPSDAKYGNTRMRIRLARQASATAVVACGNIAAQGRTQDYTIKVLEPTAATSSVTKSATSVYPNPFQDVLKISDVKGVKSISVSDVSGRQVKNMKPAAELNLSDLKTGMYIVTLNMEDGTVKSFKTIKK